MAMDFDQIVQKILENTELSHDELMARINKKREELKGIITPAGAATIIAKELKIDIGRKEPTVRPLCIADLAPGMSKLDIVGRVVRIHEPREFQRPDGKLGLRGSLLLQDKSGFIRLTLWDEKAAILREGHIKKGDVIRVYNAYVRRAIDKQFELSLGTRGTIAVNPDDPRVNELPTFTETTVKLADLKPEMMEVDVVGRVMAASRARAFERPDGRSGKVSTLTITDSTASVRVSLWNGWAELAECLNRGDAVKLENAMVKVGFRGQTELSLGARGRLIQNPPEAENLPQISWRPLKINEIEADVPSLDLVARVRQIFPLVEFERADGALGKVSTLILEDESGAIRASFWDSAADVIQNLRVNDVVFLRNVYSRPGLREAPEIHVRRDAIVEINPPEVKVGELRPIRVKIGRVEPNMRSLEVVGKVLEVSAVKEFTRSDGTQGKVSSMRVADETGSIRVSLWGEHASKSGEVKVGDVVRFVDAYSTSGLFGLSEIHLGGRGSLEINPAGEELPQVREIEALPKSPRATVGEIKTEGARVEVRGTVTHVFHRKPFFEICPTCGARLRDTGTEPICEECGKTVSPGRRVVLSFLLDDGTGNMRVVLFGEVAERLLGMGVDEILRRFEETPDLAEFYGGLGLLGKEVLVAGITRHDKFTDQLELRVREVKIPESREEAQSLLQSIKDEGTRIREGGL
jgi:replication factor A1